MIALVVWIAVVLAIDPAGSYPRMPEGPGLTVDELFNVEQGVYLVEALRIYGPGLLDPQSIQDVFGPKSNYLPDHPPLGRLWLGLHHHLAWAVAPPHDPAPRSTVTACARCGSATAFALTIWLIGWFAAGRWGSLAGCLAAIVPAILPRLWGHAHLASLETITNLTCVAAVLAAASAWDKAAPTRGGSLMAGVVLGLAFLTKIQAILLPIPLAIWCLWRWRAKGIRHVALWGLAAAIVFVVGWPWLWLDPIGHVREYFARSTDRAELSVWYFGVRYGDKAVPWHYPWVMFATTVPLPVLALGGWAVIGLIGGAVKSVRTKNNSPSSAVPPPPSADSVQWLLLANALFPLAVFSLPGVSVYDGERLFLTAFPFWGLLAGIAAARLCQSPPVPNGTVTAPQRAWGVRRSAWRFVVAASLAVSAWELATLHPCWLSYYNLLANGAAGAERLGLETTYWGDSVTRTLLEELEQLVPREADVHLAPVLHQFQVDHPPLRADLVQQSPILRRHGIHLVPYTRMDWNVEYLLIYRRRADLPEELRFGPRNARRLAEVRRKRVQLAALYVIERE